MKNQKCEFKEKCKKECVYPNEDQDFCSEVLLFRLQNHGNVN